MVQPRAELALSTSSKPLGPLRRLLAALGPGVVTGAAGDDPSGIATYSMAGARLGTSLLWTSLLTFPLSAVVQNMCGRIGMVTGRGLAGALRLKFPRWALFLIGIALLIANTVNVAADLAGMSDAAEMLSGWDSRYFIIVFGLAIGAATLFWPYAKLANVFKWLALTLFAYVATGFWVKPDWLAALRDTFVPSVPGGSEGWAMLVAVLGTTISPYLFFWQASSEVEEEKAIGRTTTQQRLGATRRELVDRRLDVASGSFFSNLVMFFVILTTASTLHRHGQLHIESAREAAEALKPLAGKLAAAIYTVGIFGVGALTIPTLTASAAYALAETFGWSQGLGKSPAAAKLFYAVVALSTGAGIALDFTGVNPMRALVLSAVINGVLAPFVLVGILLVAGDRKLMQGQPSSRLSLIIVALTALLMLIASVAMFAL